MSVYSQIPINRPKRSKHNLSHQLNTAMNIGPLYPTARPLEVIPGDTFDSSQVSTVDLMPLVHPFKGDLYLESWQFFCSNDMLEKDIDGGSFSEILLGAQDPKNAIPIPSMIFPNKDSSHPHTGLGTLWDHFGLPLNIGNDTSEIKICAYPFRAYYKIWDEYFRDENLQESIFDTTNYGVAPYCPLKNVNYKKDRFTSAFTSTQKGPEIKFSLGKSAPISIYSDTDFSTKLNSSELTAKTGGYSAGESPILDLSNFYAVDPTFTPLPQHTNVTLRTDLSNATAASINDLRLLNKLQKWEERNQLCGTRPKEYLLANYGTAPSDETLQRPVLIGHTKTPIIINSVIQNNPSEGTKTANKTGNGVGLQQVRFGKWTAKEFGWIITLSALRPKSNYTQGIHRSFIKNTVYDFFNPIFQSLGQQEILNAEVFASNTSTDKTIFGYTDRYNELRHIEDCTTGVLRGSLESWAVSRKFTTLPTLSSEFITVNQSEYDYLFNITSSAETPQALVSCSNIITAIRPISKFPHPTL